MTPVDIDKLKPCPFCGGEAEIERCGTARQSTIYRCTICGCSLETGEEWGHGRAWNRRPEDAALIAKAERVDALEAALRFYADMANPRAWWQHVTADPSHPFGHRPVGKPVPSDALLEDCGQLARNALSPKESE